MSTHLNVNDIPPEITEAARKVGIWMDEQGHDDWALMGIQKRREKVTFNTAVDLDREPSRHELSLYKPACRVPIFLEHNPRRVRACGKEAVIVDAFFPYECDHNRCAEHVDWPNLDDSFDPGI